MRRIMIFFLALAVWAAFLAAPALAKVVVHVSERTENVSGSTERDLQNSIVDHVFVTDKTSSAAALCGARPRVDFQIRQRGQRFWLDTWTVTLDIVYYYPRWKDINRGPWALREKWRDYLRVLRRHEETHGRIAKKYAQKLDEALANIPPSGSAANVKEEVRMTFDDIWGEQRRAQEHFDTRSNPVRFPLAEGYRPVKP